MGLKQSYGGMGNGIGRTEAWQEVGEPLTKKAALAPNGKQKQQNPFLRKTGEWANPVRRGEGCIETKQFRACGIL